MRRSSELLKPLARRLARPGYFALADWPQIAPARILLVACHWIGDTLWAAQVVPALSQRFPGARITAICKPQCVDLWNGLLPLADVMATTAVISDRTRERASVWAISRLARRLRGKFDLVIDLTGNRYSALFSFLLRPRWSVGFDGGEVGWLYSHNVADAERPGRHLGERPFRVIEPLLAGGGEAFAYRLPQPPQPACQPGQLIESLGLAGRPFAVVAPGAGWAAKRWSPEKFLDVAGRLVLAGWRVVLVGSKAEEYLCQRLSTGIDDAAVFCGRPLGQAIALMGQARGVIANDSGLGHLAAAMDRPTAVVFAGRTDPALCAPLSRNAAVGIFTAEATPQEVAAFILNA